MDGWFWENLWDDRLNKKLDKQVRYMYMNTVHSTDSKFAYIHTYVAVPIAKVLLVNIISVFNCLKSFIYFQVSVFLETYT